MTAQWRRRLLLCAFGAWAVLVLSQYYSQALGAMVVRRLPSLPQFTGAAVPVVFIAALAAVLRVLRRRSRERRSAWSDSFTRSLPAACLAAGGVLAVPWALLHERLSAGISGFGVPGWPWMGEAFGRAVSALGGAAFVGAAAVVAGELTLRLLRVPTAGRCERAVLALATGAGVLSYAFLLAALGGGYRPAAVAGIIALALLGGAAVLHRPRRSGLTLERPLPNPVTTPLPAAWVSVTLVALAYAAINALAPEREYDALWYHLQLPRLWLEQGRPVDVVAEYVSLYPLTWELLFGAGLVMGGPIAAKLLHFACLPALALLVSQAARRYVPSAWPLAAASIVVLTPTLLWEASTTYVDLALSLHSAAACYALARHAETRNRSWALLAGLLFGVAAATKHLGIVVTAAALATFVVFARDGSRWRVLRRGGLIVLIAALVPTPWYLRSWLASGNPVFPEMFSLFGAAPPERWDEWSERGLAAFKAHFGRGHSPRDLLLLPWDVTVHGALFGGALGPLFLVLLPAMVFAARSTALRALAFGAFGYVAVWASPVSSLQLRFLMPVVPPLALLAAAALDTIAASTAARSRGRVLVAAMAIALLTLNLPPFVPLHEADRVGWDGWLTHVLRGVPVGVVTGHRSEVEYLRREVTSFGAWQAINERTPADARVLAFSGGDHFYTQRRRIAHDATVARPAVWGAPAAHISEGVEALRRLGLTHILYDRRELARPETAGLAIASPAVQQACVPEYDDGRYWVCRLDYSRLPQSAGERVATASRP